MLIIENLVDDSTSKTQRSWNLGPIIYIPECRNNERFDHWSWNLRTAKSIKSNEQKHENQQNSSDSWDTIPGLCRSTTHTPKYLTSLWRGPWGQGAENLPGRGASIGPPHPWSWPSSLACFTALMCILAEESEERNDRPRPRWGTLEQGDRYLGVVCVPPWPPLTPTQTPPGHQSECSVTAATISLAHRASFGQSLHSTEHYKYSASRIYTAG